MIGTRRTAWFFALGLLFSGLMVAGAEAGQAGATFNVGVSIVKKVRKPHVAASARASRYTVAAASLSVLAMRYRDIRVAGRDGESYWFTAARNGQVFRLAVSQRTGRILKAVRFS